VTEDNEETEGTEDVVQGFTACALWLTYTEEGKPDTYEASDLSPETVAAIRQQCVDFVQQSRELWRSVGMSDEDAGHNLFLTQNDHGTGFWDRGLGDAGDTLTADCKPYGAFDLYAGDDGKLYHN
jgi:hypothetical protein